jgi:ubiquinone/menaquinone biosynthesis C-methylase UbiE
MRRNSFDTAASTYDQDRGFPPAVSELVADAAARLLGTRRRVLEVGVGTGRIARPLLARGVPVIGLDLSRPMMDRLRAHLPPGAPCPALLQADAEALPLPAGRLEAVVSVHVFHLLGEWLRAIAEVRRVLGPDGVFLSGYEWRAPEAPGSQLFDRWRQIVQARGGQREAGARDFGDVRQALVAAGAVFDEVVVGQWQVTRTLAHHLETIEHRTWSPAPGVDSSFFPACLADLRQWAAATFGDLHHTHVATHRFVWQRFAWPS